MKLTHKKALLIMDYIMSTKGIPTILSFLENFDDGPSIRELWFQAACHEQPQLISPDFDNPYLRKIKRSQQLGISHCAKAVVARKELSKLLHQFADALADCVGEK